MRILHAPSDVGGHAFGLSRAERELGIESDVVLFGPSEHGYGADLTVPVSGKRVPTRFARRMAFLRRAVRKYDLFHFNFGQPILSMRLRGRFFNELALLKRLGKTILVTFQGCDVRPQERCPGCRRADCAAASPTRAANAAAMLRHADRSFFLNPDLREWLPGARFLAYANVDPAEVVPAPFRDGDEIVVAHAPTDRDLKGTAHLVDAIAALKSDGVRIRLDLLEGMKRDGVIRATAAADLVVDQLLNGWYGGFAVEAMALAKPVLCFIREDSPADNPFGDDLPIVRTEPRTLIDDLRGLAASAEARRAAGAAGRRFVERHHDPRRVASTTLDGLVELDRPRGRT